MFPFNWTISRTTLCSPRTDCNRIQVFITRPQNKLLMESWFLFSFALMELGVAFDGAWLLSCLNCEMVPPPCSVIGMQGHVRIQHRRYLEAPERDTEVCQSQTSWRKNLELFICGQHNTCIAALTEMLISQHTGFLFLLIHSLFCIAINSLFNSISFLIAPFAFWIFATLHYLHVPFP